MFLPHLSGHDLCQFVDGLLLEDALRVEQLLQLGHGLGLGDRLPVRLVLLLHLDDLRRLDESLLNLSSW